MQWHIGAPFVFKLNCGNSSCSCKDGDEPPHTSLMNFSFIAEENDVIVVSTRDSHLFYLSFQSFVNSCETCVFESTHPCVYMTAYSYSCNFPKKQHIAS